MLERLTLVKRNSRFSNGQCVYGRITAIRKRMTVLYLLRFPQRLWLSVDNVLEVLAISLDVMLE
jgi:hypothetical protein